MEDQNATIDETYEFSAPRFFDFINGETDQEMKAAEHWFETAISYAPSPFMPKIREGRSVQIETLCDFGDAGNVNKEEDEEKETTLTSTRVVVSEAREEISVPHREEDSRVSIVKEISVAKKASVQCTKEEQCVPTKALINKEIRKACEKMAALADHEVCTPEPQVIVKRSDRLLTGAKKNQTAKSIASLVKIHSTAKKMAASTADHGPEICTPEPQVTVKRSDRLLTEVKKTQTEKNQTAKSIARLVKNLSTAKPKKLSNLSQSAKPSAPRSAIAPDYVLENQAIKRQKLDEGKSRQILNVKLQNLSHEKSKVGLGFISSSTNSKTRKEDRKLYVREGYVSTAELVKRFQSSTRDIGLSQGNSLMHESATSLTQKKPKLTLTRPKEPEFETSHRVRSTKVKSSVEIEEEMMANMPKFKARPVNKKILEAPSLPALTRSTPQPPEFKEFHLKTMERADQSAETSSTVSTESSRKNVWDPRKLTEPKMPRLETSLRARPPTVKSSQELEEEELEKIPKFKARPLNKKMFESKGSEGMFRLPKGNFTVPEEFHFATEERIPLTKSVTDLFDKLSLNSESRDNPPIPRITKPNPFHLNTEERGAEKEKKFEVEVRQKLLEEERARIPKATPYPYTTDYPVIPPKPERKHCTRPEPFQLESLVRHEEEMRREMEERERLEKEEAQMRIFKAQPILREDPLPLPEKERLPLTRVEQFPLHVDHRAVDRAEFDKKMKEKEMMYKRYREENESAKMMEEEKALKQLRRTLVPHARPVPNFANPFLPQKSSKETTKAKSPKLRVLQRKQRRTSVSASNMR